MSKVYQSYQSVRGVLQGTLHRRKPHLVVSAPAKGNDGSVNDAIEELEKIFVNGIGRLKVAVSDDQAVVASEAQHAEQVIEGLKANITVLEARLKETEDTVDRKDVASQKMEESLSTEIRDLQSVVRKKEEALESRESEVNDLKSKIDRLVEQVAQSELAIQQAKREAASEARHAEQVPEGLKIRIATLQAQLRQTEQIVSRTDTTLKGLDQDRNRQAIDLHAQLEPQTNGMKNGKVDIQAQAIGTVVAGKQLKTGEEKPTPLHFLAAGVTPVVTEAARETVSQDAFDRMIAEFSELANVMGSIASLIVRDHVRAIGESMEEFPQTRLTKLLESLSKEISDDKLKADFCARFSNV
jgi:predicted  nucleic acid-binding Zn-ribbon protein